MEAPLIETVPNFSEGRDAQTIERIVACFQARQGVQLLDYSCDQDHNRMVVTAIGRPQAIARAVIEAVGVAVERIDLTHHDGVHPRMGAVDVVPFIPVSNYTMKQAVQLSHTVARQVARRYRLPVYLYEQSASAPHRRNLAHVRKGGFEQLAEKMQQQEWQPDYPRLGEDHLPAAHSTPAPGETVCPHPANPHAPTPHPTAGAVAIGARKPLIAYNVNLNTNDPAIAKAIARKIRASNGGLPALKAIGLYLPKEGVAQVSMNLCDYKQTSVHEAYEAVRKEAQRHGITLRNSELIGLMPLGALSDIAAQALKLNDFSAKRVICEMT